MLSAPVPAVRDRAFDACPGAVTLHEAADGGLARIRVPGGLLESAQWGALIEASSRLGTGSLQLTSRGNVEIRGVTDGVALSSALAAAGLLPSISHERVRNVVASPLSGLDSSGIADITPLVGALDDALLATEELAELPGRFLFGLDDGCGDVTSLQPDVWLRALSPTTLTLGVGDLICAEPVPWPSAVDALITAARHFLDLAARAAMSAWRIRELPGAAETIAGRFGAVLPADCDPVEARIAYGTVPGSRPGSASLVVGVPLGQLLQSQALAVHSAAQRSGRLRITPWRSIVLPRLSTAAQVSADLTAVGLTTAAASPWHGVSACTGRPGCAKALADVRADAIAVHSDLPGAVTAHWSGCARRCGRPTGAFLDVVATGSGYDVSTESVGTKSVSAGDRALRVAVAAL